MQQQAVPRTADSVVLRQRRTASTLGFTGLLVLWVLALVASASANSSAGGVAAAASFFGIFIAATLVAWYFVARGGSRLEISGETIVYRTGRQSTPVTLSRIPGDDATLRIIPPFSHFGVVSPAQLALLGTGHVVGLTGMSTAKVTQACQAREWSFGDDKRKAAATVRHLLHAGRTATAAAFVDLFGTFAEPSDDEPATSVDAALFEDLGDRRYRLNRANGRDAYLRAAREQRAFAGFAASEQEKAERLAVADRIEAKARG